MIGGGTRPAMAAATLIVAAGFSFALLLAAPGATVTTVYVNDLVIFLDGAHRVASGQVPNRDFHTALGPLVFYLPALGLALFGHMGGAMPGGMAVTTALFAPILAHVLVSRLAPVIAAPFGILLLAILASPNNLGESVGALSFAMFYNRIGWVALAALLVLYLAPRNPSRLTRTFDVLAAATLSLVMIFSKVTFGVAALAFLLFLLSDRSQRGMAFGALLLTIVGSLAIEAVWRGARAHAADLATASAVSGSLSLSLGSLAQGALANLASAVFLGILAALALVRTRSARDAVFFLFCAAGGLVVMTQNAQPWGIISLHAASAVAAELALRPGPSPTPPPRSTRVAAPLVLAALVLPTILHATAALLLHATLAARGAGEPFGLPEFAQVRLAQLEGTGDPAFSTAYLASLRQGAALLETLDERPRHVVVLDFANPFSAGLGLAPARGDSAWLHWGRNVDDRHHIPAEELMAGADIVMTPKWGVNPAPLSALYGSFLGTAFEPVRETPLWVIHRRTAERPALAGNPTP